MSGKKVHEFVDVLVGMQWGSEGKGKVSSFLSSRYDCVVRSGGSQAGHTFYVNGKKYVNRQIPCTVLNSDCSLILSPASIINCGVLSEEIERYDLTPERLFVDRTAGVITAEHLLIAKELLSQERYGSTREGVGLAQASKVLRSGVLFGDFVKGTLLENFCADTVKIVHECIARGKSVLLEGTQGFGLCLNHGVYPFVTSRDVTTSALLSDAGISPQYHRKTIGVMRTYPIRVGGNSGPTRSKEVFWEDIEQRSGAPAKIREYTTVTGRLRRVFEQDFELLERALLVNCPDEIALMFIDYLNYEDYGKRYFDDLSNKSKEYVHMLEERLKVPITMIGTGPEEMMMIGK